jgi:hypothetical protein
MPMMRASAIQMAEITRRGNLPVGSGLQRKTRVKKVCSVMASVLMQMGS